MVHWPSESFLLSESLLSAMAPPSGASSIAKAAATNVVLRQRSRPVVPPIAFALSRDGESTCRGAEAPRQPTQIPAHAGGSAGLQVVQCTAEKTWRYALR